MCNMKEYFQCFGNILLGELTHSQTFPTHLFWSDVNGVGTQISKAQASKREAPL